MESALCRHDPVVQVRDGLRTYIAGCMSGRGAMAGAGCGITWKCSRLIFQTHSAELLLQDNLCFPQPPQLHDQHTMLWYCLQNFLLNCNQSQHKSL